MLSRLLRRLVAVCLGAMVILLFGVGTSSPLWAAYLVMAALSVFGVTLALQCAMAAHANRHDLVPPASALQLLRAWLREAWVAAKVFVWWQPFRSNKYPDRLPDSASAPTSRGIVFVHGFFCNRGVWNAWYPVLDSKQIPYAAINLEPIFTSIDEYADLLNHAVDLMYDRTGQKPLIIGHSMGGVVVRAWLRASSTDSKVHRIVTIGSPHHGTRLGLWAPSRLDNIANAHQMRFGGQWLRNLAQLEVPIRRSMFVCFYSNCDNIVFPATSATLADADNRHVAGLPHLAMALDKSIIEQSIALL